MNSKRAGAPNYPSRLLDAVVRAMRETATDTIHISHVLRNIAVNVRGNANLANPANALLKALNSLKISLKCHALSQKSLAAIAALPQWPVRF
jgi:hypothetical protein